MTRHYPNLNISDLMLIIGFVKEDPGYLEASNYPPQIKELFKPRLLPPAPPDQLDLERECRDLYQELNELRKELSKSVAKDRVAVLKVIAGLLEKIVGLTERATGIAKVQEFMADVMNIMETVLDTDQRTTVMEKLNERLS